MPFYIISGLIGLCVIIVSSELFTNSIAWAGIRFGLNRGIMGKILKSAGPALPETIIPVIAVIAIPGEHGQQISTGAILGTPLMLSSLAFGLAAAAALIYRRADKKPLDFKTDEKSLFNDLVFFSAAITAALIISFFSIPVKKAMGFLFLVAYAVYVYWFKRKYRDKEEDHALRDLYFSKKKNPEGRLVLLQAGVSVIGMAAGALFFTSGIEHFSSAVKTPAFVLSVLISPVAVKIPRVLNMLSRVKNSKEGPALADIGAALVFQGTVMIFAGIMATDWILISPQAKLAVVFSVVSGLTAAAFIKLNKKINAYLFLQGAVFYVLFVVAALKWAA